MYLYQNSEQFPIDVVSALIFVFILYEKVLENELRSLDVQGDSWTVTNDKKFHQVYYYNNYIKGRLGSDDNIALLGMTRA